MCEVWTLTLLHLRSLYSINRFLHSKDRKYRRNYLLLASVFLLLILMVAGYTAGLVAGLCYLRLSDIVPLYLATIASLLILAFGLFRAGNALFGARGYELLAAMPVRTSSVVLSRFLTLYVEDLLLTLVIMLPGCVTFGIFQHPRVGFYLMSLPCVVLIPAIPLVVSSLLGTAIMAISSGVKYKSLLQSLLMVAVVVGVVLGSLGMGQASGEFTEEAFAQLAENLGAQIGKIYPPAILVGTALLDADIGILLSFAGLSIGLIAALMTLISLTYHPIMRKLHSVSARHDFRMGRMESRSLFRALYLREARRYFASSIYVTNTIIGPILGCLMAAALCAAGPDRLLDSLPVPIDLVGLAPFILSAVFCMMTTTSCSISMEGKPFWIVQSLPVPVKPLLDSKILLNLSLMLPFYLIAEICLVIALQPSLPGLFWLIAIPALMMLFSTVLGITVNLKLHAFDWEKEEQVVKQSASAMLGGFAGLLVAGFLGVAAAFTPPAWGNLLRVFLSALLLAITLMLYRQNNRTVLSQL